MSVVKRMTANPDFLKMSLEDRNCEVEEYEDCRTRNLVEKCKLQVCSCRGPLFSGNQSIIHSFTTVLVPANSLHKDVHSGMQEM